MVTPAGHCRWCSSGWSRSDLALLLPLTLVVAVLLGLRRFLLARIRASAVATLGVRSVFFVIPALSFVALTEDLAELF